MDHHNSLLAAVHAATHDGSGSGLNRFLQLSNDDAIYAVRDANMTAEQANALWRQRWDSMVNLRDEFAKFEWYRGYMNACVAGRVKFYGRRTSAC